jgi:hypothetical protein
MGGFVCGRPGFCLDGGRFVPFVGGRARFVWWVVVVHGLLGWTTHVVSGSAVVVRGWSYPFRTVVGGGCGWVCPSSFVGSDRGEVIVVCGWLVRVTRGFKTHEKPGKTQEPVSRVWVRLGLQIPNPNPHPPPPAMPTRDIPYRAICRGSQPVRRQRDIIERQAGAAGP